MENELKNLRDRLQKNRKRLIDKLQEVDDNLESINKVVNLLDDEKVAPNDRQRKLFEEPNSAPSIKFKDLTFFESLTILFDENPGKHWKPGEIAEAVLKEGFSTKSKKFKNTVRTLLGNLRKADKVNATSTKSGWLYSSIKKDSVSHVNETESLNDVGGVSE